MIQLDNAVVDKPRQVRYSCRLSGFESHVGVGESVRAADPLGIRIIQPPLMALDLAGELKRSPQAALRAMGKGEGDFILEGEVLAETSGAFGFGHRKFISPVAGAICGLIPEEGLAIVRPHQRRVAVSASLASRVVDVDDNGIDLETEGFQINAVAGYGSEISGLITCIEDFQALPGQMSSLSPEEEGWPAIIAFQSPIDSDIIELFRDLFPSSHPLALVVPSIPFRDYVRHANQEYPTTLLITEGFGERQSSSSMAPSIWTLLQGIRAENAMVIPGHDGGAGMLIVPAEQNWSRQEARQVERQTPVRWWGDMTVGHGTVMKAQSDGCKTPSGYYLECARVALEDGLIRDVPLSNLEVLPTAEAMETVE